MTPPKSATSPFFKRVIEAEPAEDRSSKRKHSETAEALTPHPNPLVPARAQCTSPRIITYPSKDVPSGHLTIERNWRRGHCSVRVLRGPTGGVMCLQFSETLYHPFFPLLTTGSYDHHACAEPRDVQGDSMSQWLRKRLLQFDEAKLIIGSMDSTMRVWNWRTQVYLGA